jgi:hypothetical protein
LSDYGVSLSILYGDVKVPSPKPVLAYAATRGITGRKKRNKLYPINDGYRIHTITKTT